MFAKVPVTDDKLQKLGEAFEFLNTFLAGSEFAAGDALTVADISLIASVTTIQVSFQKILPNFFRKILW